MVLGSVDANYQDPSIDAAGAVEIAANDTRFALRKPAETIESYLTVPPVDGNVTRTKTEATVLETLEYTKLKRTADGKLRFSRTPF